MRIWFESCVRSVRRACHKSGRERRLLLEAVAWLGIARASVVLLPFRRVVFLLSLQDRKIGTPAADAEQGTIDRVAWAVTTAARYTPWESNCLAQAIAAKVMLRYRRVASTLYLGLRTGAESLSAHAWLTHHRVVLIGGDGLSTYKVIWTSKGDER